MSAAAAPWQRGRDHPAPEPTYAAAAGGELASSSGLGSHSEQSRLQQREAAAASDASGHGGGGGGTAESVPGGGMPRQPPISLLCDQLTQAAVALGMVFVLSLGPHWQPATVLLLMCAGLLVMVLWPDAYWRNRTWLLPILRSIIVVVPSMRSAGVGVKYGITRSLDRPAAPGLRGALVDFLRLITAIRLLPWAVQTHFMLLPPSACLFTHLCLTIGSSNLGGYCSTQMLSDPLARQRQAAVTTALDMLATPVVFLQPGSGPLSMEVAASQGLEGEKAVCQFTLLLLQAYLGVLIPLATSCYLWPLQNKAPADVAAAAAAAAATASARRTSSSGWRAWLWRLPGRACHVVQRGAAAGDVWLPWLLGMRPDGASPLPVFLYIGCCCWVLCRMQAGLL